MTRARQFTNTLPSAPYVTVYISAELDSLGSEATQDDLDAYAENLAAHLTEKFDIEVEVEPMIGHPTGSRMCRRDDIAEYVEELQTGDGWVQFLPTENANESS